MLHYFRSARPGSTVSRALESWMNLLEKSLTGNWVTMMLHYLAPTNTVPPQMIQGEEHT